MKNIVVTTPRPSTMRAYYLGRPARVWIAAFRRSSLRAPRPRLEKAGNNGGSKASKDILDLPIVARLDPDEFVRATMEWHFNPETGSAYWLRKAETLPFDPRADVKSMQDLALFPNILDELREVRAEDLIPRGYGPNPGIVGVYESGGTTGAPKRVVVLRDWWDLHTAWAHAGMDAQGLPASANWLAVVPSGPHLIGEGSQHEGGLLDEVVGVGGGLLGLAGADELLDPARIHVDRELDAAAAGREPGGRHGRTSGRARLPGQGGGGARSR